MKRPMLHVILENQRSNLIVGSAAVEVDPTCEIVVHETQEQFRASLNKIEDVPWQVAVTDHAGLVNVRSAKGQLVPVVMIDENPKSADGNVGETVSITEIKPQLEEAIFTATLFQKLSLGVDRLGELNERERAIVSLAADGIPNKSIARRLNVSIKTIEQCRRNAYHKLGIKSSAEVGSLVTFGRFYSLLKSPAATGFTPTST